MSYGEACLMLAKIFRPLADQGSLPRAAIKSAPRKDVDTAADDLIETAEAAVDRATRKSHEPCGCGW